MPSMPTGPGLTDYLSSKIEELEFATREKSLNLKRLEAQRNKLNAEGVCCFGSCCCPRLCYCCCCIRLVCGWFMLYRVRWVLRWQVHASLFSATNACSA